VGEVPSAAPPILVSGIFVSGSVGMCTVAAKAEMQSAEDIRKTAKMAPIIPFILRRRFFFENISELAENYTILVIIPYPVRIIKNKTEIFLNSKFLSQNIIIMREHCYFAIRNNLLRKAKRLLLVF
jgi:hypothetical protein